MLQQDMSNLVSVASESKRSSKWRSCDEGCDDGSNMKMRKR